MTKKLKFGVYYHSATPTAVLTALVTAAAEGSRVVILLGDQETGVNFGARLEGYVVRADLVQEGTPKRECVFAVQARADSTTAVIIPTNSVVYLAFTGDTEELYRHPSFTTLPAVDVPPRQPSKTETPAVFPPAVTPPAPAP